MDAGYGLYQLGDEHHALREAVRTLAEKEIAPYAAAVDEESRFPTEALTALTKAGFNAPHIPEDYLGEGADAIATNIVVEEVARVCASSSLIPDFPLAPRNASSASRAHPPGRSTSRTARSRPTVSSGRPAAACGSPSPPSTTPGTPSAPRPSASPRAPWMPPSPTSRTASSSASASPTSRASSSCSPPRR